MIIMKEDTGFNKSQALSLILGKTSEFWNIEKHVFYQFIFSLQWLRKFWLFDTGRMRETIRELKHSNLYWKDGSSGISL